MNTTGFTYFEPRELSEAAGIVEQLSPELGPVFPRTIASWFEGRRRPYDLALWRIYLAQDSPGASPCGIFGFYRHQGDEPGRYWVGWLGVLPGFRRKGIGVAMLQAIEAEVRALGGTELWVYTDADSSSIPFYERYGMRYWGKFNDTGLPQEAATERSIALMKPLA